MLKRFLISWGIVYVFNSFAGYFIHHVLLGATYQSLTSSLQSQDIKSKIWAFIITSLTGSFFFTLIYSKWQKDETIKEGFKYGLFIGIWMGLNMSLNTYASTGLIPFSLALLWLIYNLIQFSIEGILLAYVYNYPVIKKFS